MSFVSEKKYINKKSGFGNDGREKYFILVVNEKECE